MIAFHNYEDEVPAPCECSDSMCPVHQGKSQCMFDARAVMHRVDMQDVEGTLMCTRCAGDALESGLFYEGYVEP